MKNVLRRALATLMVLIGSITGLGTIGSTSAQAMMQPSIVHGRDTSATEFGFIVAVGARYGTGDQVALGQDCAGTLVTPLKVITAAHCLWDGGSGTTRGAKDIAVGAGLNLNDQQVVEVATATYHPDYDGEAGTYENDIAVLTLKTPILGTARMLPVVRGSESTQADLNSGLTSANANVITAGWGATTTDNGGEPDVATAADLHLFGANTCDSASNQSQKKVATVIGGVTFYQYVTGEIFDDVMMCAMGVNSSGEIVDACGGDSGGPLTGGSGASRRLVGIVSWGPDPGLDDEVGVDDVCAIHYAGVYTRVSAFSGPGEFLSQQGVPTTNPAGIPGKPIFSAAARSSATRLDVSGKAVATGTSAKWIRFTATDAQTKESESCIGTVLADKTASCSITGLDLMDTHTVTAIAYDAAGDASSTSTPRTQLGAPDFGSGSWVGQTSTYRIAVTVGSGPRVSGVSTKVSCTRLGAVAFTATVMSGQATLPFTKKGTYSCRAVTTYTSGGQTLTTLASGVLPVKIT